MDLIALLVNLIVLLVVLAIFYLIATYIIRLAGLPVDLRLIQLICLVIVLLWFVGYFAGSIPAWRIPR